MIKFALYLTKILLVLGTALLATSCEFNFKTLAPTGAIERTTQQINAPFENIKVSQGIQVVLNQTGSTAVAVETFPNYLEHIKIEVVNETLVIKKKGNIYFRSNKPVMVYVNNAQFKELTANSSARILSKTSIKSDNLHLDTSSGASITLEVVTRKLFADTSSGSTITISGKAIDTEADASSGSNIDLKKLTAVNAVANSSSGAEIHVNPQTKLEAEASSGSRIYYFSALSQIAIDESSGGKVKYQE